MSNHDPQAPRPPFAPAGLLVSLLVRYQGQPVDAATERQDGFKWERGGRTGVLYVPPGTMNFVLETGGHRFVLSAGDVAGDVIVAVCEMLDIAREAGRALDAAETKAEPPKGDS